MTPTEAPPAGAETAIGDAIQITQDDDDAAELTLTDVEFEREARGDLGDAPEEDRFLIATVAFEATGTEDFSINPYDFYYRTEDGTRYDPFDGNSLFAVEKGTLDAVDLSPGERSKGLIVFDVPNGDGEIVYAPGFDSKTVASWTVTVE